MSQNENADANSNSEAEDPQDEDEMVLDAEEELAAGEVPSKWVDAGISMFILLGFIALFIYTFQYEAITLGKSSDPGPVFWPRIIIGIVIVTLVINLIMIARDQLKRDQPLIPAKSVVVDGFNKRFVDLTSEEREFYLVIGLTILYLLALDPIGYMTTSPVYLFAFGWILGYYKPIKLTVTSISVSAIIFIAFRMYMNIPLPYGQGPFRAFHLFIESFF